MNAEMLTKLHSRLLMIIDEIDRICRKNKIAYFLDSGTALGAVRHKGFIPWDDDADIGMLRDDYDRFIEVAQSELSEKFFLQTSKTDKGYSKLSAKIRINNTFFPEHRNENAKMHQGIFVDIFPFDYVADDFKKAKKDILKARRLNKLYALRLRKPKNENIVRRVVRGFVRLIPEAFIYKLCCNHYKKYQNKKTNTCTCYAYKMSDTMFLTFDVDKLLPTMDVEFENRMYEMMNNSDYYLRKMFGDYMQLPPIEKRICHLSGNIVF